jgi:hypothetical protein
MRVAPGIGIAGKIRIVIVDVYSRAVYGIVGNINIKELPEG